MKTSSIKIYSVFAGLLIIIIALIIHLKAVNSKLNKVNLQTEGKISIYKELLVKEKINYNLLKEKSKKSLELIKTDTITIYKKYEKNLNYVNSLGNDSTALYFTNYLIKKGNN